MKKILIITAILFSIQFPFCQNDSFKTDVLKLIEKSSSAGSMKLAKNEFLTLIPKKHHEAFSKEYDDVFIEFYDKLAGDYMELYTHQDIIDLLKFYESPIGKKKYENDILILEKSMWIRKDLEILLDKYLHK